MRPFFERTRLKRGDDLSYINRFRLLPNNPFFNLYVHEYENPDDSLYFHDHPFDFVAVCIRGGGGELIRERSGRVVYRRIRRWIPRFYSARTQHRINHVRVMRTDPPMRTILVHGPRRACWGFVSEMGTRVEWMSGWRGTVLFWRWRRDPS